LTILAIIALIKRMSVSNNFSASYPKIPLKNSLKPAFDFSCVDSKIILELEKIETEAKKNNRHLTSEIFVVYNNKLFGQKRSSNRTLFPDCWDVAGGHVDEGETLLNSIFRELKEETNWDVKNILVILGTKNWQSGTEPEKGRLNPNKQMVIVLIEVKNPEELILEEGKVSEGKWFEENDLERLKEGRAGDGWRLKSFQEVFKYLQQNLENQENQKSLGNSHKSKIF